MRRWPSPSRARACLVVDGRAAAVGEALSVPAGATVFVGPQRPALRSYVAVAGGVDVEPVLGSRSTDTLACVGPPVVRSGMVLPVGLRRRAPGRRRRCHDRSATSTSGTTPGPRADWFATLRCAGTYDGVRRTPTGSGCG